MSLSEQQQHLIVTINNKVKAVLTNGGGEEEVLMALFNYMPNVRELIQSVPKKEIELYFYEYDGFYHYMTILEKLAQRVADG